MKSIQQILFLFLILVLSSCSQQESSVKEVNAHINTEFTLMMRMNDIDLSDFEVIDTSTGYAIHDNEEPHTTIYVVEQFDDESEFITSIYTTHPDILIFDQSPGLRSEDIVKDMLSVGFDVWENSEDTTTDVLGFKWNDIRLLIEVRNDTIYSITIGLEEK